MNANIALIIAVIIIIIIFLSWPTKCMRNNFNENFNNLYNYCPDCGFINNINCLNCKNCGLCTKYDGSQQCLPGNNFGAFNRNDCINWKFYSADNINYIPQPIDINYIPQPIDINYIPQPIDINRININSSLYQ